MKTFKFYLAALAIALSAGFTSCSNEYDDSEIWDKVNDLLNRVQKLEASVQQQNANITALQTMLDAIKDNVYVTSVEELADGKGYALKFSNGKEVEIYHGEKGEPGESPSITIINEGDNYYWSVNGEVLKDNDGNKLYNDVKVGVLIDWDTDESDAASTLNEIDVLAMKDTIPVFISCKSGIFDTNELYKLKSVASRFGDDYAKCVLVATSMERQ